MITAKEALNRRFSKAFGNLAQNRSDLLEQNRASGLIGDEMSGGFSNSAGKRINYELDQDRADLAEQQQTETEILDFKEKEAKEAADKAKTGKLLKTVGTIGGAALGAVLAAPTGGLSIAAGASLGASLGSTAAGLYDNTADFSTIDYGALSDMGGYFKRKKKFNNGTDSTITPQMEQA